MSNRIHTYIIKSIDRLVYVNTVIYIYFSTQLHDKGRKVSMLITLASFTLEKTDLSNKRTYEQPIVRLNGEETIH